VNRTIHTYCRTLLLICIALLQTSCSYIDPRSYDPRAIDTQLTKKAPARKATQFDQALRNLGLMTVIYGTYEISIQSIVVGDETGISRAEATMGEIPQRIAEMTNSALNVIGGNVLFIPYLPNYVNAMQSVGYPSLNKKKTPNVVLTGGITEFDRGLETRGKNTDFGFDSEGVSSAPSMFDNDTINFEYSNAEKSTTATITLDSNLLDFQTFSGISGMQAVNTIRVQKINNEKELGFSLFGPRLGLRGSIQKVEGRHAAVRLLVQLNTLEVIGKLYALPYWRLLPDCQPDLQVIAEKKADFLSWPPLTQAIRIQELLLLHGYEVPISGRFDAATNEALRRFNEKADTTNLEDIYLALYTNVPINNQAMERRKIFDRNLKELLKASRQNNEGEKS
jgi:hypothetical protein